MLSMSRKSVAKLNFKGWKKEIPYEGGYTIIYPLFSIPRGENDSFQVNTYVAYFNITKKVKETKTKIIYFFEFDRILEE